MTNAPMNSKEYKAHDEINRVHLPDWPRRS